MNHPEPFCVDTQNTTSEYDGIYDHLLKVKEHTLNTLRRKAIINKNIYLRKRKCKHSDMHYRNFKISLRKYLRTKYLYAGNLFYGGTKHPIYKTHVVPIGRPTGINAFSYFYEFIMEIYNVNDDGLDANIFIPISKLNIFDSHDTALMTVTYR